MADSKNGVFYDTKAGKVVESQPEEGIQLVAPGAEITPDAQARIDAYKSGDNAAPETVTTDAAVGKKKG